MGRGEQKRDAVRAAGGGTRMGECGPREGFSTDMVMGYPGTGNSHADWAELFLENRRLKAKT